MQVTRRNHTFRINRVQVEGVGSALPLLLSTRFAFSFSSNFFFSFEGKKTLNEEFAGSSGGRDLPAPPPSPFGASCLNGPNQH
jgi:hypothetical protein